MLGFAREENFTISEEREEFLGLVESQDLMQFGLIPELIGRMPVVTHMHELDRDAMVRILTEPRNSLTKQYQKLLEMEDVELVFEPDSLQAIADLASHPLERFLAAGLRVTLNTDNRLVSATTVTNEFHLAVEAYDLDEDAVLGMVMNGFKSAFLPLDEKVWLIDRILAEFRSLGARFSGEISRRRRVHL